jgi:hypothetical protein
MSIFNRKSKEESVILPTPDDAVIKTEDIEKATKTLLEYKEGKANLEQKIIDNEQWYKLRHWECMRGDKNEIQPVSGWLFNAIASKLADQMDNFPSPNVLPREEGDKAEAEMLSSIIPVILDQDNFEQTYSDVQEYKLKTGTGVYGVYFDKSKHNGLGDITIKKIDLLNMFWESGITDIQKSRNVFTVELVDNDLLIGSYPQLNGKLGGNSIDVSKYVYDDTVKTDNKSAVVDWYYKKNVNGKTVLHYCKFVQNEVLFATENTPEFKDRGWYDHGLYPFVFDVLYRVEGSPCGFGYIDIGKSQQAFVDRGNQAILMNMLANAKPRFFIRDDGSVREEEYADLTKDFVHTDGNLGQDSILPIQGKSLNGVYLQVVQDQINELKETTGNRDVSNGGTTSGVTASSAIAAMQEASSKLSRKDGKASYRAFRKVCYMVVELIRQFYTLPRSFRIMGNDGAMRFVSYSNANITAQNQGIEMGIDMGTRVPQFDIEITAQKQSPYSKMSQNELALQFFGAGFFNPQISDQALACLDMMDFDRKQFVMQKIQQNGTMYQQIQMMQMQLLKFASIVDRYEGTNMAQQMAMEQGMPMTPVTGMPNPDLKSLGGEGKIGESRITENARKRVAESTNPT